MRLFSISIGLFFLLLSFNASAKHIIGGDVTYECLGVDTITNSVEFRIYFTMYRDCFGGGAGFDGTANIGVYQNFGTSTNWIETQFIDILEIERLIPEVSPCVEVPGNICVEEGRYIFDITLPISDNAYVLAYQRCCRNVTIANIINAEDTGASFTVEISPEAQRTCNNSPTFDEFPPIVICSGQPLIVSQGASDVEGDVLVYEFCSPKQGGGPFGSNENPGNPEACNGITPNPMNCPPPYDDVIFNVPNYSANNPVPGDPGLSINSNTGVITGVPNLVGQYVVGVCVKEYRNGVLIGQINRDFQFNVTECDVKVNAEIQHDAAIGPQEFQINSCGDFEIQFLNESTDPNFIEQYLWEFNIDNSVVTSNDKDVNITFPGLGQYTGRMIVNPQAIDGECTDTAFFEVNVYPDITADYEFEYDTCVAGPVRFTDLSSTGSSALTGWEWDFDDGAESLDQNPSHLYTDPGIRQVALVAIDINECRDTMIKDIVYQPAPPIIIVEPSSFFGCRPANIFFNNLSVPIDSTYDITWDFGDGNFSSEISPTHIYEENGEFDVSLRIVSPIGCEIERNFSSLIEVEDKPEADFSFSPEEPTILNSTVDFDDNSVDAVRWQWNFGGQGVAFTPNPTFTFRDTGVYIVEQVVFHPSGCPDTLIRSIDVKPVVTYFMPNAFTPNSDGNNDVFLGKGITNGMREFQLAIYNRWGEQIYVSNDPLQGWNGRKNNTGKDSPAGVYIYQLKYIDPRGNLFTEKGFATLIR